MDKTDNITKHAEWSEKAIEQYLCDRVEGEGGNCLKYSNQNKVGYPDRIVLLPGGWGAWVELKSHGKKSTLMQKLRQRHLCRLGQLVYVADSKEAVDAIIDDWRRAR